MAKIAKRAVAFFDVLGFKEKINTEPLDTVVDSYHSMIKITGNYEGVLDKNKKTLITHKSCDRYIFSDSILLVANSDTNEGFVDLISYAWRFMQLALASGFPLRGAITYGDILVEPEKGLYVGKAIVDGAELEKQQDWIGAVIDNSAEKRYATVFSSEYTLYQLLQILFPQYSVPMKNGSKKDFRVINWRENIIAKAGTKALFKNPKCDSSVQIKIDNTLEFAKHIVSKGAYIQGNVPTRYRHLIIADGPPPSDNKLPKHGDEY
jgi:hypothetical protein